MKFKVGDRVKIRRGSRYYGECPRSNPAEVQGRVSSVYVGQGDCCTIEVYWDQRGCNVYRERDLELAEEVLFEVG